MSLKIKTKYSPNFDLKKRKNKDINFLIFHYTGMRNEKSAINFITKKLVCFQVAQRLSVVMNRFDVKQIKVFL